MTGRVPTNAELQEQIKDLTEAVQALTSQTKGLVTAWENATFLVAVVKWMGTTAMALSAFWYVVTHYGQGK